MKQSEWTHGMKSHGRQIDNDTSGGHFVRGWSLYDNLHGK